jgi:hypothetical protein
MKAREHELFAAWHGMINRTTKKGKKACYEGITVYEPWNDRTRPEKPGPCLGLLRFAAYVEEHLGPQNGLTLDRIDPKRGYEPGNIRWATLSEQSKNRTQGWIKPTMTPEGRLPWAHPYNGRWLARFSLGGKHYRAGYYTTQEEAHQAAKSLREEILCHTI